MLLDKKTLQISFLIVFIAVTITLFQCCTSNSFESLSQSSQSATLGSIEKILSSSDGSSLDILGWVCTFESAQSVSVDVYLGGPSDSGAWLGTFKANPSSEPTTVESCGLQGNRSYRFSIPIDLTSRALFSGQPIFIYGHSGAGNVGTPLPGSGEHVVLGSGVLIGAKYFSGWWELDPNKGVNASYWYTMHDGLGPYSGAVDFRTTHPERNPILGADNSKDTLKKEISSAVQHGLNYFQFLWYPNGNLIPDRSTNQKVSAYTLNYIDKLNLGIKSFKQAVAEISQTDPTITNKFKFMIEYCNHAPYDYFDINAPGAWEDYVAQWVALMTSDPSTPNVIHPSYLQIDGRPVFSMLSVPDFINNCATGSDYSVCAQKIQTLRSAIKNTFGKDLIIGAGGLGVVYNGKWQATSPDALWSFISSNFDYTGEYEFVPDVPSSAPTSLPFSQIYSGAQANDSGLWYSTVEGELSSGQMNYLPMIMSGYNTTPWQTRLAGGLYPPSYRPPTVSSTGRSQEWVDIISRGFEYLRTRSNQSSIFPVSGSGHGLALGFPRANKPPQKAISIYAWNEFGEGGFLAPANDSNADPYLKLNGLLEVVNYYNSPANLVNYQASDLNLVISH